MKLNLILILSVLLINSLLVAIPFTTQGEIKVPDAYILNHKMAEISYTSYMSANKNGDEDDEYNHDFAGVINVGLYDRLELGFVGTGNEMFYANLKAKLVEENEFLPAIAIGVDNLFSKVPEYREDSDEKIPGSVSDDVTDVDDYIRNSFYFVMSKSSLLRGLPFVPYLESTMHLGIGSRRFKGNLKLSKQLAGLFVGFEAKPVRWMSMLAEMDGYNLNAGLKFKYKNVALRTCAYRVEELDRRELKYAVNLIYTLDNFSQVKLSDENYGHAKRGTVVPGKQIITKKGDVVYGSPLLDELEAIRERRKRAEKQLEEIRELLKEE